MASLVAPVLSLVLLDSLLCLLLWAEMVLLRFSGDGGGLPGVWAFGAVRWITLSAVSASLAEGRPLVVLRRLAAMLGLLQPLMESGWTLLGGSGRPATPHLDPCMTFAGTVAAVLACLLWEGGLSVKVWRRRGGEGGEDTWPMMLKMMKCLRPDVLHLVAAFSSIVCGIVCDAFVPFLQGKVIDMLRGHNLQSSFYSAIAVLALVSLGSSIFSALRSFLFKVSLSRLNRRLQLRLFGSFLRQEIHFFQANHPGSLSCRLHSDVNRLGRTVALNANMLFRGTVNICVSLLLMCRLSWELTLLSALEMPLLAAVQNRYFATVTELKNQTQDCLARAKDQAHQSISGIRLVRSFRGEREELRRYSEALERTLAVKRRAKIYSSVFLFIRRLVTLGIKVLMLVQARSLISSNRLTVGSLVSFLLYQRPMSVSLKEILYACGDTVSTMGIISKVFGYLDRKPQWKEAGNLAPEHLEGRVVFKDVCFTYPSSSPDNPALKSVSIQVLPGKITALVGPSGSGKTSCVSLLKRMYEPQSGQVLLDGEPLHLYQHKYLHQKVALVSQNPVLFSGSVRYNIEYGLTGCSLEDVKKAADRTKAHDFISQLEQEYDTDVGERGGRLSEGERQCLAVTRALVRNPQVLILDEATSKLDVETEHAVLQEVLASGRTVLVVAHHLKTVEKADHIVFLEKGEVVEEGTHQELMDRRGRYFRLKEELFSSDS